MTASTGSGLGVAFLDVLSCSLGAGILLFLIFSTLEHQGDRQSKAQEGLLEEAKVVLRGQPADAATTAIAFLVELNREAEPEEATAPSLSLNDPSSSSASAGEGMATATQPWAEVTRTRSDTPWHAFVVMVPNGAHKQGLLRILPPNSRTNVRVTAIGGGIWKRECVTYTLETSESAGDLKFDSGELTPADPSRVLGRR